jgi:thiamine biosynthesis lipoprotein
MQRCAEADAWSTAFMVMGDEQAIETADRLGIAVYMLVRDGEGFSVRSSRAFDAYLVRPANQNGATPTLK